MGCKVPLVGDFHYNSHKLLHDFPECAKALYKMYIISAPTLVLLS